MSNEFSFDNFDTQRKSPTLTKLPSLNESEEFSFGDFDSRERAQEPNNKENFGLSFLKSLVESEKQFGEAIGQGINVQLHKKTAEENNARYMKAGKDMMELAKRTTDPKKQKQYFKTSQEYFQKAGEGIQDIIGGEIKTNKEVIGAATGTALDIASAGTYGMAAKTAKTGQLLSKGTKIAPTVASKLSSAGAKEAGKKIAGGAALGYAYDVSFGLMEDEDNMAALTPGFGTLLGAGLPALGYVFGAAKQAIKGAPLEGVVEEGIKSGIKPSVVGKKIQKQIERYYAKATDAVKSIINNKNNLKLTDEFGEAIANKRPETLQQFAEAVDQTKKVIFEEYNALTQRAEGKQVGVTFENLILELRKAADDQVLNLRNSNVAKYAADMADKLEGLQSLSPNQAQEFIASINKDLQSFYRNPTFGTTAKVEIDALIANNMRKALDETIMGAAGTRYQKLKNLYGALKTIERDINHRAVIDARKANKSMIDFTDIFTYGDITMGTLSGNPAQVARGVVGKAASAWYKHLNNPNTIIKKMFQKAEKAVKEDRIFYQKNLKSKADDKNLLEKMFPQPGKESPAAVGEVIKEKAKKIRPGLTIEAVTPTKKEVLDRAKKLSTEIDYENIDLSDELIETMSAVTKGERKSATTGIPLFAEKVDGKWVIEDGKHRLAEQFADGKRKFDIITDKPTYLALLDEFDAAKKLKSSDTRYIQDPTTGKFTGSKKISNDTFGEFFQDWGFGEGGAKKSIPKEVEKEAAKYKPKEPVTLYRGIEKGQKEGTDAVSSWTYSKDVAQQHAFDDGKVITKTVNPDEILIDTTMLPKDLQDKFHILLDEEEVILKPQISK